MFQLSEPHVYNLPMLNTPLLPLDSVLPRMAQASLQASLADTPVVLLQGPRQCGKTTLARSVAEPAGFGYLSFDDDNLVRAARADPPAPFGAS